MCVVLLLCLSLVVCLVAHLFVCDSCLDFFECGRLVTFVYSVVCDLFVLWFVGVVDVLCVDRCVCVWFVLVIVLVGSLLLSRCCLVCVLLCVLA